MKVLPCFPENFKSRISESETYLLHYVPQTLRGEHRRGRHSGGSAGRHDGARVARRGLAVRRTRARAHSSSQRRSARAGLTACTRGAVLQLGAHRGAHRTPLPLGRTGARAAAARTELERRSLNEHRYSDEL